MQALTEGVAVAASILGLSGCIITGIINYGKYRQATHQQVMAFMKESREEERQLRGELAKVEAVAQQAAEEGKVDYAAIYDAFSQYLVAYSAYLEHYLFFLSLLRYSRVLHRGRKEDCWEVLTLYASIAEHAPEGRGMTYSQIITLVQFIRWKATPFQRKRLLDFLNANPIDGEQSRKTNFGRVFW